MPVITRPLLMILALGLASPIFAQEAAAPADAASTDAAPADTTAAPATEAPADAAPAAEAPAADGVGTTYIAESHGDWQLRCVRTEDGSDPCQLYQLLKDKESGDPISEISLVALPEGGEAAVGATVITPLETLLTQQLNITVDGGTTKRFPFTFCTQVGCVARIGLVKEDVASFKKGKVATVSVVPAADPSRVVEVDISLAGFTAGLEAVTKANAPKK